MPEDYPSTAAPVLELSGGCMGPQDRAEAIQHLHNTFQQGEVSLTACAATACLAQTIVCLLSVHTHTFGDIGLMSTDWSMGAKQSNAFPYVDSQR